MVVSVSGSNTEIVQFDWFINGQIFPVLPAQRKEFENALLMSNKN